MLESERGSASKSLAGLHGGVDNPRRTSEEPDIGQVDGLVARCVTSMHLTLDSGHIRALLASYINVLSQNTTTVYGPFSGTTG